MTTATLSQARPTRRTLGEGISAAGWAVALGLLSGMACVGVRVALRMLQWVFVQHTGLLPEAAATLAPGRRLLTPLLGAVCATAVLWAARRWAQASRFREYVEAVRFENGRIPFSSTLWRTVSSAFSVATGAAIGREGSMIQFAAAVTSWVGERSPIRSISLPRQVAYGAAAAVAAAYQAPIAGVFFALEIVLGEWVWVEVPQLLLASTAGWLVSRLLLGQTLLFVVPKTMPLSGEVLWALPLALAFGVLGPLYQKLLRSARFARRLPVALVWSGLLVGLLSLRYPAVWGNGDVALSNILQGKSVLLSIAAVLVVRLVATSFCVGTGTVGGVFTPTLFAGAALGAEAGYLLHLSQPLFVAVIGMSALMAAVTHAPFMAALMAVELTGQWHLLPILLLCNLVAWLAARTLSSYSLYGIASPEPLLTGNKGIVRND